MCVDCVVCLWYVWCACCMCSVYMGMCVHYVLYFFFNDLSIRERVHVLEQGEGEKEKKSQVDSLLS